jgi:tetratricopeptide (TPR) repeat protein
MKMINKLVLVVFLIIGTTSFSQDGKAMQEAFAKSFMNEDKADYKTAIQDIQNVYSDKSYLVNLRIGWLSYLNKDYVNSVTYYKKACALMPTASEPLWGLALPLIAQEKWIDVENTYKSIVRYDPKNSLVNYRLGMIYYYRKNYVDALKYFDVTLTLFPLDYDAITMSAWTNYFLGKKEEAKVLFNRVLLMYQSDASAIEGLALCNKK